ncbi:MAG: FAD-dependent thymidylate synthase [Anaerolineae bacterium]
MTDPRLPSPNSLAVEHNILGDGLSWLELQDMLPHPATGVKPDLAIVNGARVSFLGESKGDEQDRKLLFYLLRHRHTSPFEQVELKFRVRAPVVVWWQWVRHRTWHFNFQSGRYTPFEEGDFYVPTVWRRQSESNKQGSEGSIDAAANRRHLDRLAALTREAYAAYEEALADGVAREQARLFLPAWGSYYIAICKVDAWNLMHFLRLRMAPDAQWEIRQYAHAIHRIFSQVMPWTAEAYDRYIRPEGADQG